MNWGIIGLGNIANKFASDIALLEESTLYAVASRSHSKSLKFQEDHKALKAYDSYEALFNDDKIDIVYIATPHDSHEKWSIEAMKAGKHVLCEKPIAVNSRQLEGMIKCAKENNVFLMEALWSRFNPTIVSVLKLINDGHLGSISFINASFSFYRAFDPASRLFALENAGGSILDVGIYPAFLSYLLFGTPKKITATGILHNTGIDLQANAIFEYENKTSQIMCGLLNNTSMQAEICGSEASIFIDPPWHEAQGYRIRNNRTGNVEQINLPTLGKGFTYEIMECENCIKENKQESELWSWNDSTHLMKILDNLREKVGVIYPFE